jgi:hypothetical protein
MMPELPFATTRERAATLEAISLPTATTSIYSTTGNLQDFFPRGDLSLKPTHIRSTSPLPIMVGGDAGVVLN